MDKAALEQKRLEMRLRSERLERERRILLRLAVHNSARLKAEKYGIQWEDVQFYEEEVDYENAKKERQGGSQAQWQRMQDEDMDDSDGEGEAEQEDSSDEWADVSSSGGSASSDEREASGSTSYESAQEELVAEEGPSQDVPDEEMAEPSASPPPKRPTLEEWTDCSYLAGDEFSGGDEPEPGPAFERRCGTYRDF